MGVPLFQVQHIIDAYDVQVFSSNYALYSDISHRVMSVLGDFTPEIELYSIDEAFLSLEYKMKYGSLTDFGRRIKETVYKWTGIPLSIGMAETKTLAKLANHLAKKSEKAKGVLDLSRSPYQDYALEHTPVGNLWGIGRQYTKLLNSRGIVNARQLRDVDVKWARKALTVVGARIVEELRGNSCLPLEICPPARKSLTCSRSFGNLVEKLSDLREAVATFTIRIAERLRKHQLAATAITVFAATNRFAKNETYYSNSATVEMAYPTDTTTELMERAMACTDRIYQEGRKFKSAGVMLNGLVPASPMTIRMHGDDRWIKSRSLMKAIDRINARMGRDTIKFGVSGFKQNWKTKFDKRSPRYTTNWNEILNVPSAVSMTLGTNLIKLPDMIKLFFSYSHRDEELRNELEIHLAGLKRQGIIEAWHDRRIGAGKEFDSEISEHLESAQIILLLVSPYFIASDYCYDIEMKRAMERHNSGEARVIPVILHPCDWQSFPFGKLMAVPKDGKPVSKYPNQHDAFLEVIQAIRAVAKEFETASDSQTQSKTPSAINSPVVGPVSEIRSSNLRVKKTFSQREKDKFEREAYEYIEKYFENSLAELEARNPNVETHFRRIDANTFTATAYVDGREASSCVIKYNSGGGYIGGITYSYGRTSLGSGMNEALSVHDDGYSLFLKALGMNLYRSRDNEQMSFEGAAEAYWEMFIRQLQQ